ncbi:MAG: TraR/DksA C4-type zinc finger protein [Anaerolineae bacterium]
MQQSPLSAEQMQHYRELLLAEKRQIETELRRRLEEFEQLTDNSDKAGHFGDQGDEATDIFEQEKNLALRDGMDRQLAKISHALARIDQGTYGLCEVCGKAIDPERLDAFPSATTCIQDARKVQSER